MFLEKYTTTKIVMDPVKKQRTKCRSCESYIRVKKGHWKEPDWKSKAGKCNHPFFLLCDYTYNITGGNSLYEPKKKHIRYKPLILSSIDSDRPEISFAPELISYITIPILRQRMIDWIIKDIVNRHQNYIAKWKRYSINARLKTKKYKRKKPVFTKRGLNKVPRLR